MPGVPPVSSAQLTNSLPEAFGGALFDPELRTVLRTLEQQPGVNVLNAPEITTESGRQAQVQSEEMIGVLTNTDPTVVTKLPFGPTLDVVPECSFDEFSVRLTTTATLSRLLDKPDIVLPRMQFDQLVFTTDVWDTET